MNQVESLFNLAIFGGPSFLLGKDENLFIVQKKVICMGDVEIKGDVSNEI